MITVESAMKIAVRAHRHQMDKGGKPYIKHPTRMAEVGKMIDPEVEICCWLHDVIEDTDYFKFPCEKTLENINRLAWHLEDFYGLSPEQAKALLAITKFPGEKHWDYLPRVKKVFIARVTKVIDIDDNLSPVRLHCLPYDQQVYLTDKYTHSKRFLLEVKDRAA